MNVNENFYQCTISIYLFIPIICLNIKFSLLKNNVRKHGMFIVLYTSMLIFNKKIYNSKEDFSKSKIVSSIL